MEKRKMEGETFNSFILLHACREREREREGSGLANKVRRRGRWVSANYIVRVSADM